MGFWGNKLYQNDTALDVRDQFETLLRNGLSIEVITNRLITDFEDAMGDLEEEPLFWLALADSQCDFGLLLPSVKGKALYWIENQSNIDRLNELKVKILSHKNVERKNERKTPYKCEWNVGDVYAYQLKSDLSKSIGLFGRYFLIQKVDEYTWHSGHIVPIVYVKITNNSEIPSSLATYEQSEYVQTWFTKYEDRFLPIDGKRPLEDMAEKSKLRYDVDEYGYLPEFRLTILITSKRIIPSDLIYVGNFIEASPPSIEFVPHSKDSIVAVSWGKKGETFETKLINRYCGHNLRHLSIYHKSLS